MKFDHIKVAQIPHTMLLPNVAKLLEEHKVFADEDLLEEFMCGADIFSEMLEDNPDTGVLTHFTVEESEQWVNLYKYFQTDNSHYIHIIKI